MDRRLQKIVYLVLVICMIAGLVGMSQPVMASAGTFRTTADVNIRSEPSTDASVVPLRE